MWPGVLEGFFRAGPIFARQADRWSQIAHFVRNDGIEKGLILIISFKFVKKVVTSSISEIFWMAGRFEHSLSAHFFYYKINITLYTYTTQKVY